ncbi:MAG TPA: hypothetical protein VLJ19_21715 [Variovorax sp.]|nr:hypothetical protein [Variovorax sp.]
MMSRRSKRSLQASFALLCVTVVGAAAQGVGMSFFITSRGLGNGADLGGLAGADKHCQTLATAAGAGSRTWRAYLSADKGDGVAAVYARDRIGKGPWRNARGEVIAKDVKQLHGDNNLTKQTALTERGEIVNGSGDTPNRHDILTGSTDDGSPFGGDRDFSCGRWTKSGDDPPALAFVGHHDRTGLDDSKRGRSWNSAHFSRGCSQEALRSTGGDGLFYCFAVD